MGLLSWLFSRRTEPPATPPESFAERHTVSATQIVPDLWRVFGSSIRGASHERLSLPNQDAMGWRPESMTGPPLLLALADGHGSAKCFRSDTGSRLAVEMTLKVFQDFIDNDVMISDLTSAKRAIQDKVPVAIERLWKQAVERDLNEHPLLVKEVARLEEQHGTAARQAVERDPVLAYGTTVLGLLLHASFLACVQLGDGDILIVTESAEVLRPMENDSRLFANETTSLGSVESWRDFRTYFQAWEASQPALVLACTDGYSNAFSSDDGFRTVGSDLLDLLRSEGVEEISRDLPSWLEEASRHGSGDDVTAMVLFRTTAIVTSGIVIAEQQNVSGRCVHDRNKMA